VDKAVDKASARHAQNAARAGIFGAATLPRSRPQHAEKPRKIKDFCGDFACG
jgi:hypothetical protein